LHRAKVARYVEKTSCIETKLCRVRRYMRAMCAKIQRGILTTSAQIARRAALCETSLIKAPAVFARRIKLLGVEFYSFKRSTSLYKYKAVSFKCTT